MERGVTPAIFCTLSAILSYFLSFYCDSRKIFIENNHKKISIEKKNVKILKEWMQKIEKAQSNYLFTYLT